MVVIGWLVAVVSIVFIGWLLLPWLVGCSSSAWMLVGLLLYLVICWLVAVVKHSCYWLVAVGWLLYLVIHQLIAVIIGWLVDVVKHSCYLLVVVIIDWLGAVVKHSFY